MRARVLLPLCFAAVAHANDAAPTRKTLGSAACVLDVALKSDVADLKKAIAALSRSPMSEDLVSIVSERQKSIRELDARRAEVREAMVTAKVGTSSCAAVPKRLLYCQGIWMGLGPVTADGECDRDPDLTLLRYRGSADLE